MRRRLSAILLMMAVTIAPAAAQTYPSRPITVVVPYPAGGAVDVMGRIIAEQLSASLGQTAVVENVGGGAGNIGVGRVARAAPDGYTLGFATGDQLVVNAAIYPLQYDVVKDFEPIALVASSPFLIVSKSAVPASNLSELAAWLKTNHSNVSQGHNGAGGAQHLCGIDLQKRLETQWQFVPYRGAAPALQDVAGGQIDLMCTLPGSALGLMRAGKIKAYAVTARTRLTSAPDVPTVDEAGLPGLHSSVWTALFAPKGTPRDIIIKLSAVVMGALADPAVGRRVVDIGMEIPPAEQRTPEALAAYQQAEIEKWWPLIKAANIKGE
ncbi:MAG: tripartite tricarboxylate transporter substrate binding protein BugD [Hyphomicrobiales bacterium]|nr:tripartite tricarboxylate transporter substrate binding protein BugD [Hyphomicrobiales bacterium]